MAEHDACPRQPGRNLGPDFHVGRPTRVSPWYGKVFGGCFGLWPGLAIAVVATYGLMLQASVVDFVRFRA
jgi:hypothetical protein